MNQLDIYGQKIELARFISVAEGSEILDENDDKTLLCFDNFAPMPKELINTISPPERHNRNLTRKFGADNWYDWRVKNWGTKWPASGVELCSTKVFHMTSEKPIEIIYDFETAWSPPEPIVMKMSKMFPKLKFKLKYWEAGMGFRGIFIAKNGKIIKNRTYNYMGDRGG